MADREVHQTGKAADGTITTLCSKGQPWSPRSKADAIRDIEKLVHRYYVVRGGQRAWVEVAGVGVGKYLRTNRDSTTRNNLAELPDC